MTTSNIFAYRSTQHEWEGGLFDCTDPDNPVRQDLTGYDKVYIVFTKPDGTQWPTEEQLLDGYDQKAELINATTPTDPVILTDANIIYKNLSLPTILDMKGWWEYTPVAKFPTQIIRSGYTEGFWVV